MASRGGAGGGAIAPGPGPVVGARAKLDFFLCVDRKSVGDPGGGSRDGHPPPLGNLSRMQSVRDRDRSPPPPFRMWMTSHGQCPRGGACECPRVAVVFNFSEGG